MNLIMLVVDELDLDLRHAFRCATGGRHGQRLERGIIVIIIITTWLEVVVVVVVVVVVSLSFSLPSSLLCCIITNIMFISNIRMIGIVIIIVSSTIAVDASNRRVTSEAPPEPFAFQTEKD